MERSLSRQVWNVSCEPLQRNKPAKMIQPRDLIDLDFRMCLRNFSLSVDDTFKVMDGLKNMGIGQANDTAAFKWSNGIESSKGHGRG